MEIEKTGKPDSKTRFSKYEPLLGLKEDESVVLNKDEYQAAYQYCRNHKTKIIARSESATTYRIWKVQNELN